MNTESSSAPAAMNGKAMKPSPKQRIRRNICIGVMAAIIGVVLLIVILAFTVFKAKRPVTTINSVILKDLNVSVDVIRIRVHLNIILDVDLSVKNPNKVGFKYTNSTALLNYKGQLVGEAPVPAGKISADSSLPMNVTVTIFGDRLLTNSTALSDVLSGELPLNTYTRISGKVNILNIFKVHATSTASCDFTIFISNRTVSDQQCQYKTSL